MKYLNLFENFKGINFIDWLNKNYPDKSKWKEIEKLELTLSEHPTGDLVGIENLINLKKLNCSFNDLTTLESIENLINLEVLHCYDNKLKSLRGIEKLINLKKLQCSSNKLKTINNVENLLNIEELYCGDNQLSSLEFRDFSIDALEMGIDITDMNRFKKLNYLSFYSNKFSDRYTRYIKNYCKEKHIYCGQELK